jgi:hypothetical protein
MGYRWIPVRVGYAAWWQMGTGHSVWHFQYLERGSEPFLWGWEQTFARRRAFGVPCASEIFLSLNLWQG